MVVCCAPCSLSSSSNVVVSTPSSCSSSSSSPLIINATASSNPTGPEDLDQTKARAVTYSSFFLAFFTIITCYLIAVHLHHVPAWLPMISDCAVEAPEKYIFRLGIILSAGLLELNCMLMYFFLHTVTLSGGGVGITDKIGVFFSSIASFSLACVGAINEQEDDPVHSAFAVVFFFGFNFYMITLTRKLYLGSNPQCQIRTCSLVLKTICCIITSVALTLFLFFSRNWGKYAIEIALCEWIGTMTILVFNLSFCFEFGKNLLVATLFKHPSSLNVNTNTRLQVDYKAMMLDV